MDAIIGSAIFFALVSTGTHEGPTATGSNGFGEEEMLQAFIAETVFTFIFVLVVLGSTDPKRGAGALAGLAIGLTLVLVHIVCIPVTGTSVNPARSIYKKNSDTPITLMTAPMISLAVTRCLKNA